MKTFVITVSERFPIKHARAGVDTNFVNAILDGEKIHTIRANYELWKKRFEEVLIGEAKISLRFWTGKPYASKQAFIKDLECSDLIGCQKLVFLDGNINKPRIVLPPNPFQPEEVLLPVNINELAANDGLSTLDWLEWFKEYDLTEPLAVIQLTGFRYLLPAIKRL